MNDKDLHQTSTDAPAENAETTYVRVRDLISQNRVLVAVASALVILVVVLVVMSSGGDRKPQRAGGTAATEEHAEGEEHGEENEVELAAEELTAAGIEIESVTQRVAVAPLTVTGTVEANEQQTQQVSSLVAGRVDRVYAALGDFVTAGSPLAVISSPEVAEMQGKLLEAETRLQLGRRNVERVKRAENRAAVLAAKAKLEEAEATLRRTQKLVELGAGAGKDLIAAEAAQKTAKAEYDYQSNIAINREVQEAQAEVETAETEVNHLRQSLRSLGSRDGARDISAVSLVAPISGQVTERTVNAGAGVAAGAPLFTVGNLSTVWVIANVPEALVNQLRVGSPAEIRLASATSEPREGRVTYIHPRLDEQTRTAKVRVEAANPGELMKVGMFVQVDLQSGSPGAGTPTVQELVVPAAAVQRIGERTVVFVPKEAEPGHFEMRDVELGGELGGYRRVISGLSLGEKVVTKGSFTLKTQKMKGELGEHGH